MKKYLLSMVCAGLFIGSIPLHAMVSKRRAVICALPQLHAKYSCTPEEKAAGKKILKGAAVGAIVAALTALAIGGISFARVQAEKQRLSEQERLVEQMEQKRFENYKKVIRADLSSLSIEDIANTLLWGKEREMFGYLPLIENILVQPKIAQRIVDFLSDRSGMAHTQTRGQVLQDLLPARKQYEQEASEREKEAEYREKRERAQKEIPRHREREKQYEYEHERQKKETARAMEMSKTHVSIDNDAVKQLLGLDTTKRYFKWYEVFGYQTAPSRSDALRGFRSVSIKYHPDKHPDEPVYAEVMQALTAAKSLMD